MARPAGAPLSVLAIGAHPDDIEIAAGGTLLSLAERHPGLRVRYVFMTGTAERQQEARAAARAFLPGADLDVELPTCPTGGCPPSGAQVKEVIEALARRCARISCWRRRPATRTRITGRSASSCRRCSATSSTSATRSQVGWRPGRPNTYFPLTEDVARRKVELLDKCYPSQRGRDWWGEETFLALARLRGVECRARYAEAFTCTKLVIS